MLGLLLLSALTAPDAGLPLIPRAAFFETPAIASPQLAPDGTKVAFLAPDERGVPQLVVRTVGAMDDVRLTSEATRGPRSLRWTEDSAAVLFTRDADGDERLHVFVVTLADRATKELTPWAKTRNELLDTSAKVPEFILLTSNRRDVRVMDVLRVQWKTGVVEVDTVNPGDVTQWFVDADLKVRAAKATLPAGATDLRVRDVAKGPWRSLIQASVEEQVNPLGFTLDGKGLVLTSTVSSETDRVVEKSLKSGTERLLATTPKSGVIDTAWNRVSSSLRAVSWEVDGVREWQTLDWSFGPEASLIEPNAPNSVDFVNSDRVDQRWLVSVSSDVAAPRYLVWDRKLKQAMPLGSALPSLDRATLLRMTPVSFPARDGVTLQALLTKPEGSGALPLVVLVHAGPWARDKRGFHAQAQWLANRGAAVLQVNFRGSTGGSKRFVSASYRQWGQSMQDDLADAVSWAVSSGNADASRIAIAGTSYGGYAALMGLARNPDLFRCGVDFAGPVSLLSFFSSAPSWWKAREAQLIRRVGNPNDPKDRAMLTAASPASMPEKILAPVLIGHGANDARQKWADVETFIGAVRQTNRNVTAVSYTDEGHWLARAPNRLDFAARTETFLASCLGTRVEVPAVAAGSSAEVR